MSFGFGIGDFLACLELANKIRKDYADAPELAKSLSQNVQNMTMLLTNIMSDDKNLSVEDERRLRGLLANTQAVLREMEALANKYSTLKPDAHQQGVSKTKRVWERLRFDKGAATSLQEKIVQHVTTLDLFRQELMHRSVSKIERYVNDQERQTILDWVAPSKHISQHTSKQVNILDRRQSGTGSWILDAREFKEWLNEPSGSTLYCPGVPGAGKTYLFAMLVDHLHKYAKLTTGNIAISYMFCSYDRSDDDDSVLVRTFLRMLAEQNSRVFILLARAWKDREPLGKMPTPQLFELLGAAILVIDQVFVLIDALDEQATYLSFLARLVETQQHSTMKLLVTARPMNSIAELLFPSHTIKIVATQTDVREYVSHHVTELTGAVRGKDALQQEIIQVITQNVEGMFLLAKLYLDDFDRKSSVKSVRNALQKISTGSASYDRAYYNTVTRILDQDQELRDIALKTILILSLVRRPLTADELCHALAIEPGPTAADFDEDNVPDLDFVLSSCGGLVIFQPENGILQFVHKSTKDYFASAHTKAKLFPHAEAQMQAICYWYKMACKKCENGSSRPFLAYLEEHWGYHVISDSSVSSENTLGEWKLDFKKPAIKKQLTFPLPLRDDILQFGLSELIEELGGLGQVLVQACRNNRANLVEVLLTQNAAAYSVPEFAQNSFYKTMGSKPVLLSYYQSCCCWNCGSSKGFGEVYPHNNPSEGPREPCSQGKHKMPMLLSAVDKSLFIAVEYASMEALKLLLDHGVSATARNEEGLTPLGLSVALKKQEVVDLFLHETSSGLDLILAFQRRLPVHLNPEDYDNALCYAENALQLLPAHPGWSPKYEPEDWLAVTIPLTALSLAAYKGFEGAVIAILQYTLRHPDYDARKYAPLFLNALLCAMRPATGNFNRNIFRALQEAVDVNATAPGLWGWTALHIAIWLDDKAIIQLLLADTRVDPNIQDQNRHSALSMALSLGNAEIVSILIAHSRQNKGIHEILSAMLTGKQKFWGLLRPYHQDDLIATINEGHTLLDDILCSTIHGRPVPFSRPSKWFQEQPEHWSDDIGDFITGLIDSLSPQLQPQLGNSRVETLNLAISTGSAKVFNCVLRIYPQAILSCDDKGRTPLMAAASINNLYAATSILQTAAEQASTAPLLNATDEDGMTAFSYVLSSQSTHYLCMSRLGQREYREPIFSMLTLDPCFDIRQIFRRPTGGQRLRVSPLMQLASELDDIEGLAQKVGFKGEKREDIMLKFLNMAGESMTEAEVLHSLCEQEDLSGKSLVAYFCKLTNPVYLQALMSLCPAMHNRLLQTDSGGLTMLMHAARASCHGSHGHGSTLRYLLDELKIPVDLPDTTGRTALQLILGLDETYYYREQVAAMLMEEYGADPQLAGIGDDVVREITRKGNRSN